MIVVALLDFFDSLMTALLDVVSVVIPADVESEIVAVMDGIARGMSNLFGRIFNAPALAVMNATYATATAVFWWYFFERAWKRFKRFIPGMS